MTMKLSEITSVGERLNFGLPSLNRIQSICRQIQAQWPDIETVPEEEHEVILRKFKKRDQDWYWEGMTVADVVRVAHVAFLLKYRTRNEFYRVRRFLIEETKYSTSATFLAAMMSVYTKTYQTGSSLTQTLSEALQKSRHLLKGRWAQILSELPEVLEVNIAPQTVGNRMFNMEDPWNGLKRIGFADPFGEGLLTLSHLHFVELMKPTLTSKKGVQKMLTWIKPPGHAAIINGAAEAIDALLDPWSKPIVVKATDIQDMLTKGLVDAYGDPRVRGSNVAWEQIKRQNRMTFERWLTGTNIQFFLDVVSRVEDSHMWEPRREFWLGLYKEDRIDAAWVAFSPLAESIAEDVAKEYQNLSELSYGRQIARGSRTKTSLLVLKLGNCVVVEGSHSYKVQIFNTRNRNAPPLFQQYYDCDQIRLIPGHEQIIHLGHWRERVRTEINLIA